MFGRRTQDGRATLKHELAKLAFADGVEWAQDDVSGVELDPKLVKEAREVEMAFFRKMQVYTREPRAMQRMKGGKVIGARWVDVNKGDPEKPDMRSRLVGQEFNTGKNDELYASTPTIGGVEICDLFSRNVDIKWGAEACHGQLCQKGMLLCAYTPRHLH